MSGTELRAFLKRRIVGLLHVGRLEPGSRLDSIREVSRETGVDHRAVAEAYRSLEAEGLVEIRRASGVYVADRDTSPEEGATAAWVTEVYLEGWHRRLSVGETARLLATTGEAKLRAVVADSVLDTRMAVAAELRDDFGLVVEEVELDGSGGPARLPEETDVVVTTAFHEETVRSAVGGAVPVITVVVNPEFAAAVDALLTGGPVTGVVLDPEMRERAMMYFAVTTHRDRVRVRTVAEIRADGGDPASLETDGPVLMTRAARRELGLDEYHLIPAPPTLLSPSTARSVLECVVQRALRS